MTEYVVNHAAVNVWDPDYDLKEAKRERFIWQLRKNDVVTAADLRHANIDELTSGTNPALKLKSQAEAEADLIGEQQYDPGEHTVDEVNAYLDGADENEIARVLEAEAAGKDRAGIVGGPHAA